MAASTGATAPRGGTGVAPLAAGADAIVVRAGALAEITSATDRFSFGRTGLRLDTFGVGGSGMGVATFARLSLPTGTGDDMDWAVVLIGAFFRGALAGGFMD